MWLFCRLVTWLCIKYRHKNIQYIFSSHDDNRITVVSRLKSHDMLSTLAETLENITKVKCIFLLSKFIKSSGPDWTSQWAAFGPAGRIFHTAGVSHNDTQSTFYPPNTFQGQEEDYSHWTLWMVHPYQLTWINLILKKKNGLTYEEMDDRISKFHGQVLPSGQICTVYLLQRKTSVSEIFLDILSRLILFRISNPGCFWD